MSRSRKHTPVSGNATAPSDKPHKRMTSSKFRARQRDIIKIIGNLSFDELDESDLEVKLPKKRRDALNPYASDKDGKHYFGKSRWMTPADIAKAMRK